MKSPNFDSRDGCAIDTLIVHYTGMKSKEEALARLCDAQAKVSAHYLIDEAGEITALVDEAERAWHAGVSLWQGESNLNQRSIGVELVNGGHEFGYTDFPKAQMEAFATLAQGICRRHPIPMARVLGHADVAPTRKQDPGEKFDWQWLASRRIGVWPATLIYCGAEKWPAEEGLKQFGYDTSDLPAAIMAFQRHFRPEQVTGEWDAQCQTILAALVGMV